jgi:hypothetical protein
MRIGKKYLVFISFILLFFFSCNNTDKSNDDAVTSPESEAKSAIRLDIDCSTIANFFIGKEKADSLMINFETVFMKKRTSQEDKRIVDSFWIDNCVIRSFSKFLNDSSHYDGVRIYSMFKTPVFGKNMTGIIMAPTVPEGTTHRARWGVKIKEIASCKPLFDGYNVVESDAKKGRRKFEKNIRGEKVEGDPNSADLDSLSRGIWFSKCVIDSLTKYLEKTQLNLDGVNLHCAAYFKKETGTKQIKDVQSTFLFVLTEPNGSGGHRERWDIISKLPWVIKKIKDGGGYNHGELCPSDCPTGEK